MKEKILLIIAATTTKVKCQVAYNEENLKTPLKDAKIRFKNQNTYRI